MVQVTEGELAFLARQREVLGISYERHVAILLDVGCTAAQFDRMVEFGSAPTAPTAAAHSDGADASGRPASLVLLPGSTRQGFLEKRQVRTPATSARGLGSPRAHICTGTGLTPAHIARGLGSPLPTSARGPGPVSNPSAAMMCACVPARGDGCTEPASTMARKVGAIV